MTRVNASCPECGDVAMGHDQVTLIRCADTHSFAYSFTCPDCSDLVTKPCNGSTADLLVSAGVALRLVELPLEMFEVHEGEPFTENDVADFLIDLHEWDGVVA